MAQVIKLEETKDIIPTLNFKYGNYPFEVFNPVQSTIYPHIGNDKNAVIAASTSAGKTVIAEMFACYTIHEKHEKFVYLCPLKALAQEKIDDWTDPKHHFSKLKTSICTGDYQITDKRLQELNESNIVIMTSEMMNHRVRMLNSEKSEFLKDVGVVVVDESHLLTVEGRGDDLETALMRLTGFNKNIKVVLLSATMPNVNDLAGWLTKLTDRDTLILESTYRPCKLTIHYEKYEDGGGNSLSETTMMEEALNLVFKYENDKFIVFVHSKRLGHNVLRYFQDNNVYCDFHYADLNKEKRNSIENSFKNKNGLRVLVATSGLAAGVNTPARRVIVMGTKRNNSYIPVYDINQMVGRAGRPAYDKEGDAYVFIGETDFSFERKRIEQKENITSRLLDSENGIYKNLAFQMLSEINSEKNCTQDNLKIWFERSFAFYSGKNITEHIFQKTLEKLIAMKIIEKENDVLTVTSLGKISAYNYICPFTVYSLRNNFLNYLKNHINDDYALSFLLANIPENLTNYMTSYEKNITNPYCEKIKKMFGSTQIDSILKTGYCFYQILSNNKNHVFPSLAKKLKNDYSRILFVLGQIDFSKTNKEFKQIINDIQYRIGNDIPKEHVELVRIDKIGKKRAEKLFDAGFKTKEDILKNIEAASKIAKIDLKKLIK